MGGPYQILLPLLGLFLVRVDLTDLVPMRAQVKVLKVYDGDTLLVWRGAGKMKVRLSRIDAPEMGQPFLTKQGDAGKKSKECLLQYLKVGDMAELVIEKQDIYGRMLGDLDHLSLKLVEGGCATLYPHAVFSSVREKRLYLNVLRQARRKGLGLWKWGGYRQPKAWRKFSKRSAHRRWRR